MLCLFQNKIVLIRLIAFYLSRCCAIKSPYSANALVNQSGYKPAGDSHRLGILYGNTLRHALPALWTPGIHFATRRLLRLAIILYGFRVSFNRLPL